MVKSFFFSSSASNTTTICFFLSPANRFWIFPSIARQRRKRIKLRTITTANFPSIRLMQNLWREFSSNCFLQFYNYCRFNSLLAFVAATFRQLDEDTSKKVEKIRLHLFQQLSPSLESFFFDALISRKIHSTVKLSPNNKVSFLSLSLF